ncbi:DUF6916 family protein [Derxia gummosa]|uniref:DUF6916 family protein n=1 Tax=Derxia gummosa DSM 723 TaxID=1121388 RepID=A0A8B6X7Y0_9BURK|nr:hypothetical protein [Derxia gummosa]
MNLPDASRLRALIGRDFDFAAPGAGSFAARLDHVTDGLPMDAGYRCYRAQFVVDGAWAMQANYRVTAPDGEVWQLLLTPVRPGADGRPVLEAVVHTHVSQASGDNT